MPRWRDNWPLLVALGLLWVMLAATLVESLRVNHGHLVYSLDDAYIHMALAKHLAGDGVWGITRYAFSSSQSSLLWPLLLALVYLPLGPSVVVPLVLNMLFASLLVGAVYLLGRRAGLPPLLNLVLLLELVAFMPMNMMAFDGMEHLLQSLVSLVFVYLAVEALAAPAASRRQVVALLALMPVVTATRYEGLFLAAVVAPLFLLRRRWALAFGLPVMALLPVGAYGLVSLAHGNHFLPNSLLMKSNLLLGWGAKPTPWDQFVDSPLKYVVLPALALYAYRLRGRGFWQAGQLWLLVFLGVFALQATLAMLSRRYEAYLLTIGLYALGSALLAELQRTKLSARAQALLPAALMGALCVLPPGQLGVESLALAPIYTTNIYQQQYQMGKFLRQYYQGQGVAVNDVGAVDYYADIKLLDLWGLGSVEVVNARRRQAYGPGAIRWLARTKDIRVAFTYPEWFANFGGLPEEWLLVGIWKLPVNLVCGGGEVYIYAVDPAEAGRLHRCLVEYGPQLPPQVQQVLVVYR